MRVKRTPHAGDEFGSDAFGFVDGRQRGARAVFAGAAARGSVQRQSIDLREWSRETSVEAWDESRELKRAHVVSQWLFSKH